MTCGNKALRCPVCDMCTIGASARTARRPALIKSLGSVHETVHTMVDRVAEARRSTPDLVGSALCAHYRGMGIYVERMGQITGFASGDRELRGLGDPPAPFARSLCLRSGVLRRIVLARRAIDPHFGGSPRNHDDRRHSIGKMGRRRLARDPAWIR